MATVDPASHTNQKNVPRAQQKGHSRTERLELYRRK
jgi:hypothetical protein